MANSRVAIYARLSRVHGEEETSTGRQIASCTNYAKARDWRVAEVLRDVDFSGFRAGVTRPGYERMVELMEESAIDVVVVWKLDRLMRRPSEFERFWAICERHDVSIASVTEPVDTTTPVGVAIVRVLITFASLESTVKSERISSRFAADARAGSPVNFGHRVFGYVDIQSQVVCEEEAALIREAARRVLAGETCTAIARDFRQRGVIGSKGTLITNAGLRSVLMNPRLVGDRSYRGTVVAHNVYATILDRPTAAEVLRVLATRPKSRGTASLLCGLLICGVCGCTLHYGTSYRREMRIYRCGGSHGCNRIGIVAHLVEGWVRQAVCQRIEARWKTTTDPRRTTDEELRMLRTHAVQIRRLHASYYGKADISRTEFVAARRYLLDMQGRDHRRLEPQRRPIQVPDDVDLAQLSRHWEALDQPARRALIDLELSSITVHPSPTRGGCKFNPDRLEPRWVRVGAYPNSAPP